MTNTIERISIFPSHILIVFVNGDTLKVEDAAYKAEFATLATAYGKPRHMPHMQVKIYDNRVKG